MAASLATTFPESTQELIDFTVERDAESRFLRALATPPDAVFITYMTPQAPGAYAVTRTTRDWCGRATWIVHGGVHATSRHEEALSAGADVVVLKEGECTAVDLIKLKLTSNTPSRAELAKVEGIAFTDDEGTPRHTGFRPIDRDLDRLPSPNWNLFPISSYSQNLHVKAGTALPILMSRGCPANCRFCSSPFMWDRRMRYRKPERVVEEMETGIREHGVPRFHFYDDDFLVSRAVVSEFVDSLRRSKLDVEFLVQARTDSVIRCADLLPKLRSVGGIAIEVGVESADEEVLRLQEKREDRAQIAQAISAIRDSGMRIASCNIMSCNPGETIRGHYLHNAFLHDLLNLNRIFVGSYFTLFPGSFHADNPEGIDGMSLTSEWGEFSTHEVTFVPGTLLRSRPRASRPELDGADLVILSPVILRSERVAGASLGDRLALRKQLRRIYAQFFDGTRTLEEIGPIAARAFGWTLKRAYQVCTKLLMACAQVGMIADEGCQGFEPDRPAWYVRARQDPMAWYRENRVNMFYFNDVEDPADESLLEYGRSGFWPQGRAQM